MLVLKHVNNISEELRATIPQLKEGEIRRFKMLNGVPNNHPDMAVRTAQPIIYGFTQIPCQDRIKDPFDKGSRTKEIGVVEQYDIPTERPTKYRCFVPGSMLPVARTDKYMFWNGEFALVGGNLDDEELFEYLWICNYNSKNPYRDKRTVALFEPIETDEEEYITDNTTHKKRGRKPKEEVAAV